MIDDKEFFRVALEGITEQRKKEEQLKEAEAASWQISHWEMDRFDSIDITEMSLALSDEYGKYRKDITPEDIAECKTLGDVLKKMVSIVT